MALKKDFSEGSRYYYAVIVSIVQNKCLHPDVQNLNHRLQLNLFVRDSQDEKVFDFENELYFDIPVEFDNDPLSVTVQSEKGNNSTKMCYEWIKTNVELFKTFEDV